MVGKRLLVLGLCLCLFPSGVIAEKLEKDTVIQGIKCAKGRVAYFYKSGKLKKARLSQKQEIQGIKFPKGAKLGFYESGKLNYIDLLQLQDQKIQVQGIKCATYVRFHESGKIASIYLSQDQEIQGIECAKEIEEGCANYVRFYESGKLESACFPEDEDQEIQGMRFLKGTRFTLYESGEFLYAYSFEEQEIQGIKFPEGTHLCFYESGKLQYVDIHQDQEIQGIKFLKGTHLGSGKLRKLAEEILKRKINWKNKIKTGLWIILIIGVILAIRGIIPQIILTQIRKLRKQERK